VRARNAWFGYMAKMHGVNDWRTRPLLAALVRNDI
jgi:hypothetical protein